MERRGAGSAPLPPLCVLVPLPPAVPQALGARGWDSRANPGIHSHSSEGMELLFKERSKAQRRFYDEFWNEARENSMSDSNPSRWV